jgi:hypothetical protein
MRLSDKPGAGLRDWRRSAMDRALKSQGYSPIGATRRDP